MCKKNPNESCKGCGCSFLPFGDSGIAVKNVMGYCRKCFVYTITAKIEEKYLDAFAGNEKLKEAYIEEMNTFRERNPIKYVELCSNSNGKVFSFLDEYGLYEHKNDWSEKDGV